MLEVFFPGILGLEVVDQLFDTVFEDLPVPLVVQLRQIPVQTAHLPVVLHGSRSCRYSVQILPDVPVAEDSVGRIEIPGSLQLEESGGTDIVPQLSALLQHE
ncbi:hypothetical protein ES708_33377 [subsurface metagenome]